MNTYSEAEVRENALKYFNNDELATTIWIKKYNLKNKDGIHVESGPLGRFRTIAREVMRVDAKYGKSKHYTEDMIYESLVKQEFLPGGSMIAGIGNNYSMTSLGNCFVIGGNNEDSYGSILKNDEEIVQIAKRRGGVGHDISHYRPKGTTVKNAAGSSSGATSFMNRFSNSTREVGQDGRRGALMLSMHINHLDIMDFITKKDDDTSVTGANVSVKLTDEFMRAVEIDGIHQLRYPIELPFVSDPSMVLNKIYKSKDGMRRNMRARELFDKIVEVNWRRAEPGILFWDTIIRESPADRYPAHKTISTNPCGEIPLSPYDSCRLLSVNLTEFIINPFTPEAEFDLERFLTTIVHVTRTMDNIITLEIEKIEAIISKIITDPEAEETKVTELNLWNSVLKATIDGRRSGISLIGHGDMLAMLGMDYASDASIQFVEALHEQHALATYTESQSLAAVRGAFRAYDKGLDGGEFLTRINQQKIPRRNIALLTIPPSGTLSILLNNQSSGIEPVFAPWYSRRRKVTEDEIFDHKDKTGDLWQTYYVFHPNFSKWAKINGISQEKLESNKEHYLAISPYAGNTSHYIDPIAKVRMQGAIQKYVDHSISMTTNLPESASKDAIEEVYMEAWKSGCKGATIYRDGSRDGVLNTKEKEDQSTFNHHRATKRPRELTCDVYHPSINGQKYIVMVGILNDKPYEVFALKERGNFTVSPTITQGVIRKQKSKQWQFLTTEHEIIVDNIVEQFEVPEYGTVTRLASLALRTGADVNYVVKVLNDNDGVITDYAKVIARQLKKYTTAIEGSQCPSCGETMVVEGGCKQCKNPECGYGQCG